VIREIGVGLDRPRLRTAVGNAPAAAEVLPAATNASSADSPTRSRRQPTPSPSVAVQCSRPSTSHGRSASRPVTVKLSKARTHVLLDSDGHALKPAPNCIAAPRGFAFEWRFRIPSNRVRTHVRTLVNRPGPPVQLDSAQVAAPTLAPSDTREFVRPSQLRCLDGRDAAQKLSQSSIRNRTCTCPTAVGGGGHRAAGMPGQRPPDRRRSRGRIRRDGAAPGGPELPL
jgi:hypothetical protein